MIRLFAILVLLSVALGAQGALVTPPARGAVPPCPISCTPGPTPCVSTAHCGPPPTPCAGWPCPTPGADAAAPDAGGIEYQFSDDGPPHTAAVFKESSSPWFGYAGARVALAWFPGDAEAVIYLPPPACQWTPAPWQPTDCTSVCPPQFSCYPALSTYRHPDADPAHHQVVLVLGEMPFAVGGPGTPVPLRVPGDGTARWRLP